MTRAPSERLVHPAAPPPMLRLTPRHADGAPAAPSPEPDPAALVNAARGGDRASFARLYHLFAPLVHGVLLARVRPHEADDLMQDVFLRAWRNLASLRNPSAVGAWLAVMARRAAATHRRTRWARAMISLFYDRSAAREPVDPRPAPATLTADEVLAAIRSLPVPYREALTLRLVEQMTGPQIAARLGMTHGSVRVKLCKGMALLRAHLQPEITP